jgi:signal transduction histidine kinase
MSMEPIKTLLIIEDNPGDARLLREMLRENGACLAELIVARTMSEAMTYLSTHPIDVILLNSALSGAEGLAAIRRARVSAPGVPLVVLSGMDDEDLAAQSLQEGAQDYLIKGQTQTRGLLRALRYAIVRKQLERVKDEFVSTVSHELRTPLTSLFGSLGLLTGNATGKLPEPTARLLAIAQGNSRRMLRLVNDILDIQKLESGHVAFDLKRVGVGSLLVQTVESIRGFAEGHNVKIRFETAVAVDDVRADKDRLAQVFTNLLFNAIKFSPPDGQVVVTVAKAGDGDRIRVSVRDQGAGISPDFRSRIFEKFAQADATNALRKGGTGLGLSIVKQIVDRLGGEVGFDDAPGGGTIFYVDLPVWPHVTELPHDKLIRDTSIASVVPPAGIVEAARDCLTRAPAGITEEAV